jgi:hypothetical protein
VEWLPRPVVSASENGESVETAWVKRRGRDLTLEELAPLNGLRDLFETVDLQGFLSTFASTSNASQPDSNCRTRPWGRASGLRLGADEGSGALVSLCIGGQRLTTINL